MSYCYLSCWKSSSNICSYPRNRGCLINCHYPRVFTLWNMSVIPRSHTGYVYKLFPRIFSVHDLKCRLPIEKLINGYGSKLGTESRLVHKKSDEHLFPQVLNFDPYPTERSSLQKMEDDWGFPLVVNMACCKIHMNSSTYRRSQLPCLIIEG